MALRQLLRTPALPALQQAARRISTTPVARGEAGHDDTNGHNGWVFGENPDKARKWGGWEMTYYTSFAASVVILGVGLTYKPKTDIKVWALDRVKEKQGM
mmetsp:Transcript_10149/g.15875  ORF Transcript_10149/g.15875 Transcript_10149/m.15875 type:complete len:100 (-) Transcript_10149:66-365(-)